MNRFLLSIFLLLAGHELVFAVESKTWIQDIKAAQIALGVKDYKTAYKLYLNKSDTNPLAQFSLGMFHQNGWGRKPDKVAACNWFEKAAYSHVPAAEHFWGDCLAQGIGRTVDILAAISWYRKAASHGHMISQCSIADYYIQGKGVARDVGKGIKLCSQVAQTNSPPAMLKLARYYAKGEYIPQDLANARYWYQQAAELHAAEAQYQLGVMLSQGEGGKPDLHAALFWLETAASEGYAPAYLPTAILYANEPVQATTGALAPEHLAKVYLWTSAAKVRGSPEQIVEAKKIEAQVLSVMPDEWRINLDKQVAEHLAKYSTNDSL